MDGYWQDDGEDKQESESERPRDSKIDQARAALQEFFKEHPTQVFYERQLEIIYEKRFFHWITSRALRELRDEERIASDLLELSGEVSIRFYRARTHRFWKRQSKEIMELVRTFSRPQFTRALGQHGELMLDAALPTVGFVPKARDVRAYGGKFWEATGHDLDRVFERDGVAYGAEIKNTLPYIPLTEFRTKLDMCDLFGVKPMFIVRMAPKSYIEEVRRRGGFTLILQYQLYPHGFGDLAARVRNRLQLPVDCPTRIAQGTMLRLLNWHLRHLPGGEP